MIERRTRSIGSSMRTESLIKILMLGNTGVGKTSILKAFVEETPLANKVFISTIGIDFKVKEVFVKGRKVKLQVWDTAGQEKYHSITKAYYRDALGYLVVFDLTNQTSYRAVVEWLSRIKINSDGSRTVILVGNKCDCENRVVTHEEARAFASSNNVQYFETSALLYTCIEEVFLEMAEMLVNLQILNESKTLEEEQQAIHMNSMYNGKQRCKACKTY